MNRRVIKKHQRRGLGTGLVARLVLLALLMTCGRATGAADERARTAEGRPRIIVSTDVGGTDYDDFQSLVHLLVYADRFDIEGLVASRHGPDQTKHIHGVIDAYERDFANLRSHSERYPMPAQLRAVTKQGAPDA